MGILGVLAAIAVLVGSVQTAVLTATDDAPATKATRTPTAEVQPLRTEDHHTVAQSNR